MDTAGMMPGSALATGHPHDEFNVAYYGTAPSLFRVVMAQWGDAPAGYTFVDLGCGKGRAVLLASEMGFRDCVGVELNPGLAEVARANLARWTRAVSPVRIECGDATEFAFPAGKCLAYLFHPFTGEVLARLLAGIAVQFAGRAGELDLVYVNPQFDGGLAGFVKVWEMPVRMSAEDAAADYAELGFGVGEAWCSGWRWVGVEVG